MSCGKRPTQADLRLDPDLSLVMPCAEHDGHRGDHRNETGQTWAQHGSRGSDRPRGLSNSGRPMRPVGEKQQIDTDVVTGIMAERVHRAFEMDDRFLCECFQLHGSDADAPFHRCGRYGTDSQGVLDNWHPHHDEKRRNGPKANRHNVMSSRSRPSNIYVVAPSCHDRIERNAPEFADASG